MSEIHAYYNGSVFVPLSPVNIKINQPVIITIQNSTTTKPVENGYSALFGMLSAESYTEIVEALSDTEKVDANEW